MTVCTFCESADIVTLKDELAKSVRGLFCQGHVSSGGGNHSIRISMGDHVIITPSGYPRSHLKGEDIITIDLDGNVIEGMLRPTIEVPFHTEIYRRSNAGAVCHTHSPYAQALALSAMLYPTATNGIFTFKASEPLPRALKGHLPILEYRQLGSRALANLVAQASDSMVKGDGFSGAIILLNHGIIGLGRCIHEAKFIVEVLEEWSRCQLVGKTLSQT